MQLHLISLLILLLSINSYTQTLPEPILDKNLEEENRAFGSFRYETMPYLECCKDSIDQIACTNLLLLNYIYKHIYYPPNSDMEGMVITSFEIEIDGHIDTSKIKVLRTIGAPFNRIALKITHNIEPSLGRWIPGTQNGKAVVVRYLLPIRFKQE